MYHAAPDHGIAHLAGVLNPIDDNALLGADILVHTCGSLAPGESVAIICDDDTAEVASLVAMVAGRTARRVVVERIPALAVHGAEPPDHAAEAMKAADLVLGLTSKSMAHTQARLAAGRSGARYLSLPDYSLDLLRHPSLRTDYRARAVTARAIADRLSAATTIRVRTAAGTDVTLSARGRTANCCPGLVRAAGDLGSPPDIEVNVSPLEAESNGVVVVDGSIPFPGFGLLESPVTLHVEGGSIRRFDGAPGLVARLERLFESVGSPKAYVLAECGIGLNPLANLTGIMLTDEGALGTAHFGFGSNATVGGINAVNFHIDFVFRNPEITLDGQCLDIGSDAP